MSDWKAGDKAIYIGPETLWDTAGDPWPAPYGRDVVYTVDRISLAQSPCGALCEMLVIERIWRGGTDSKLFAKPPSETHFKHLLTDAPRESEVA